MTYTDDLMHDLLGILPGTGEADVLRLLIDTGLKVVGGEQGSLLLLDEAAEALTFVMTVGDDAAEENLRGQRVPMGMGITGLAASTLEVQIGAPKFKDIQQTERKDDSNDPDAVIAAPMLDAADRLVGVITAVSFEDGKRFTEEHALLYAHFATIAGIVVEQRQRIRDLEEGRSGSGDASARGSSVEREIIASVGRLVHSNPEALKQILQMLRSIESLSGTDRSA